MIFDKEVIINFGDEGKAMKNCLALEYKYKTSKTKDLDYVCSNNLKQIQAFKY